MIIRPVIRPNYHMQFVPGEGVFLLGENHRFVLEGQNLWSVISLIDGVRTTEEIAEMLKPYVSHQDIYAEFALLEREGHIIESDPAIPPAFAAFWSEMNVDTRKLASVMSNITVQVLTPDGIDAAPMIQALQSFGLRVAENGNLLVVIVNDYLCPFLEEINKRCLSTNTPWMLLKPTGVNIWLGPMIIPGRTACWSCLENRLRHNREVESFIEKKLGPVGPFPVAKARVWTIENQTYCMAVIQLLRWIGTSSNASLESQIVITEALTLNVTKHVIVKRPQCPQCGNAYLASTAGLPINLQKRTRSSESEGGDRAEGPEITYNKFSHHISPLTGVVNGIFPSKWHGAGPLKVYLAGHNFALKNDSLYFLKDGLRTNSSGKGKSDAQARTSALCEALERFSGLYRGEEVKRKLSYEQIKDEAIHPNACMLFSEKQYAERIEWLKLGSRFQIVPLPFEEHAQIDWSPIYSYTHKKVKYLPTSYLYYGYPSAPEQFFCWADSNGNAAGSTLEDACLQGFFEVVERDSVCLWWYNQVQRPKVDLDSLKDPYIHELQSFYAGFKREFWVLDLTTDTGIPAFAAINRRTSGPTEDIILGFGAHLDARIGIIRAITEMNQFMPAVLNDNISSETNYSLFDKETTNWWKTATLQNQPYLQPLNQPDKNIEDFVNPVGNDILDQLHHCFSIVENLGHEVLLLDQTRPDIGLNVVKVVVPGMRHFWARFAPGRLFDVPVKLGWLQTARKENELNPIAMFL